MRGKEWHYNHNTLSDSCSYIKDSYRVDHDFSRVGQIQKLLVWVSISFHGAILGDAWRFLESRRDVYVHHTVLSSLPKDGFGRNLELSKVNSYLLMIRVQSQIDGVITQMEQRMMVVLYFL